MEWSLFSDPVTCYLRNMVYYLVGQFEGELRLVSSIGSTGGSSGRLEIYHNLVWGTVCINSIGSTVAAVACRQLGYTHVVRYGSVGRLRYDIVDCSYNLQYIS